MHFDRIFLLSHMRAYTSLAGHLLGSHPQINGYYEMHQSYANPAALDRQLAQYQESDALKPNSRYLFDKLLHNDYVLMPERLEMVQSKVLMSLREPKSTIQSIVHLYRQKDVEDLYASPVEAAKYYSERVKMLAEYSRNHPDYFYFDAELWQRAPERLLPRLTQWLELDSPLREEYQTFSHTGKPLKGDSSPRIHRGSIDKSKSDYSHITIPPGALLSAQQAYEEARAQLMASGESLTLPAVERL